MGWNALYGIALSRRQLEQRRMALVLLLSGTTLAFEVDKTGLVTRVVDGDTIDVDGVGRIRLADITTPEVGQPGATEATDYTSSLVSDKTVYLDIDDVYGKDQYGRWVAVVYVRHNSTHLLNINEALLEGGYAVVWDFPNEFDPNIWSLYVYYAGTSPGGDSTGAMTTPQQAYTKLLGWENHDLGLVASNMQAASDILMSA